MIGMGLMSGLVGTCPHAVHSVASISIVTVTRVFVAIM